MPARIPWKFRQDLGGDKPLLYILYYYPSFSCFFLHDSVPNLLVSYMFAPYFFRVLRCCYQAFSCFWCTIFAPPKPGILPGRHCTDTFVNFFVFVHDPHGRPGTLKSDHPNLPWVFFVPFVSPSRPSCSAFVFCFFLTQYSFQAASGYSVVFRFCFLLFSDAVFVPGGERLLGRVPLLFFAFF